MWRYRKGWMKGRVLDGVKGVALQNSLLLEGR